LHGVGTANAAITFVNGLTTGTGAAAAIGLTVRATVDLERVPVGSSRPPTIPSSSDSRLARATLSDALRRFGGEVEVDARLEIASEIPPSRGLKSSSAVGVAIARSVANAFGQDPAPEVLARASADVSQAIGLSATGAFDDALASAAGGVVVTDNGTRTVLRRGAIDREWTVVLWSPPGTHEPSPEWAERFRAERDLGGTAVAAAERGDWLEAMSANTELVERVVGYDYRSTRKVLGELGALASGVSGLGPTLASVVPRPRVRDLVRRHPAGTMEVTSAEFVGPAAEAWESG
jgi:shikimate kinase